MGAARKIPRPGRSRPPGPEEKRGATATSGQNDNQQPDFWNTLRQGRFWIILLVLLALNWLLVPLFLPEQQDRVTIPYTLFKQQVAAGNVAEITSQGDDIQGIFKQPIADPNVAQTATAQAQAAPQPTAQNQQPQMYAKFATQSPSFAQDQEILPLLQQHNVQISARPLEEPRSVLLTLLLSFAPTLLLLGGFFWLTTRATRAAGGGMFSLGRSRARRYDVEAVHERITFEDVAGIDEVENELVEIVDFLQQPDKYQRLGGRIPKGVLLVGPPGALTGAARATSWAATTNASKR